MWWTHHLRRVEDLRCRRRTGRPDEVSPVHMSRLHCVGGTINHEFPEQQQQRDSRRQLSEAAEPDCNPECHGRYGDCGEYRTLGSVEFVSSTGIDEPEPVHQLVSVYNLCWWAAEQPAWLGDPVLGRRGDELCTRPTLAARIYTKSSQHDAMAAGTIQGLSGTVVRPCAVAPDSGWLGHANSAHD